MLYRQTIWEEFVISDNNPIFYYWCFLKYLILSRLETRIKECKCVVNQIIMKINVDGVKAKWMKELHLGAAHLQFNRI